MIRPSRTCSPGLEMVLVADIAFWALVMVVSRPGLCEKEAMEAEAAE